MKPRPIKPTPRVKRPRRAEPGTIPGTLRVPDGAHETRVVAILYDEEHHVRHELDDPARLATLTIPAGKRLWLQVVGLKALAWVEAIGARFGLHRLALEDVLNSAQRPKMETFEGHVFAVFGVPRLTESHLEVEQLSVFLGQDFLVSFQEKPGSEYDPVESRLVRHQSRLRAYATDYLAYALMDAAVDLVFPVIDQFSDRLDDLEERLFDERRASDVMPELQQIKRSLLRLTRFLRPLRQAIDVFFSGDDPVARAELVPYWRDCQDHVTRALEQLETLRELESTLVNIHLSISSQRMNEVMRVLTIISTVFIPLSFIAGVYGMNFNPDASPWNMPELSWFYGYPFALGLMAVLTMGLGIFFWRRGWLSRA